MDLSTLASTLPAMMQMLPLLMQLTNIMFQLFFVWFFGSIAIRGIKGRKTFVTKFASIVLTGALCLFAGASFAGFMPFISDGILGILQLDLLAAGFIASIVTGVALSMLTHGKRGYTHRETVGKLRRKIAALEEMLKQKTHHLSEKDMERIAEKVLPGYSAKDTKTVGSECEVTLKKGDREATVVLDIWDGDVKGITKHEPRILQVVTDPYKVAGLVMLIALVSLSALFFEGLPDPNEDLANTLGMDVNDISEMAQSIGDSPLIGADVPEGCISPVELSQYSARLQDREYILNNAYEDEAAKSAAEEACGASVLYMIMLDEDRNLVVSVLDNNAIGYQMNGVFCDCIDTGL
jgi:hypothetical protein